MMTWKLAASKFPCNHMALGVTSGGAPLIEQGPHHSLRCLPHGLPATLNYSSNPIDAPSSKPRLAAPGV